MKSCTVPKPAKIEFKQEVSKAHIIEYLKYRSAIGEPIKIYYKNDRAFRVFYSYTFDDKYLRVPTEKGYSYTYLIDRIRNVEL